jgi:hypothetical protein
MALIVFFGGTASHAQQEKWKTVRSSAFGGYVISYDIPTGPIGWLERREDFDTKNIVFGVGGRGKTVRYRETIVSLEQERLARFNKKIGFTPPGTTSGTVFFSVRQYNLPEPMTLKRWVKAKKEQEYGTYRWAFIHDEGSTEKLGKEAFYYVWSPPKIWKDGRKVPASRATGPTHKTLMVVVNDRVLLEVRIRVDHFPEQFKGLQPIFDRMVKSIKFTPVFELDAARISRALFTQRVRISQGQRRQNFFLIVQPSMAGPPGWAPFDPIIEHAIKGKPRGRLIAKFRANKDPAGPSLMLVIEGMPLRRPLENTDYFATADRLIDKLMTKHGPGKITKTASPAWSFCMPQIRSRYRRGTGKTALVRTYSGENDRGRKIKALVYTMGGLTAACNLIFIAEPSDFDKALPDIEATFKSIDINPYSSAIR